MNHKLSNITKPEMDLIVELLQREHEELLKEIHHSEIHDYRDKLKDRLELVDALTEKLQAS